MTTEQTIRSLINTLNDTIASILTNTVYVTSDENEKQSAIALVKAYQTRVNCLQSTLMELQGLGNTVMSNLLNEKK